MEPLLDQLNGGAGEAEQVAAIRHLIDALVDFQIGSVCILAAGAVRCHPGAETILLSA